MGHQISNSRVDYQSRDFYPREESPSQELQLSYLTYQEK